MVTWITPTERKGNPWMPLPGSSYSTLDRLSVRTVNRIVSYPPTEWFGNTIFLRDMYTEKMHERLKKLEAEAKFLNKRWANNPLPAPAGVAPQDWLVRCIAADRRERRALYGVDSDETIKAWVDGTAESKISESKTSMAKINAANAKKATAKKAKAKKAAKAKKESSM